MSENTGVKGFISLELERVKNVTQNTIEEFVKSDQKMNQITDAQLDILANKKSICELNNSIRLICDSNDMSKQRIITLKSELDQEKSRVDKYMCFGFISLVLVGIIGMNIINKNTNLISVINKELRIFLKNYK